MKKKLLALLLTVAMGMSLLAGCGGAAASSAAKEPESSVPTEAPTAVESQTEPAPQEQEAVSVEETAASEQEEEPIAEGPVAGDKDFDWSVFEPLTQEPVTLTMFYTQPPPLAAIMDTPNDMSLLYQKFEEITNVHIDFQMVNMMDAATTYADDRWR